MKTKQRDSRGMIALVILVILIAGVVLWWFWFQNEDKKERASVTVGTFIPTLTTIVAESQGFLEEENLEVTYPQVTGLVQQMRALRDGEYDFVQTSPDNVADYRLNKDNPLGGTFDIQMVAGNAKTLGMSLVVQPEIKSFEDLRGKTLGVDARTSAFAIPMYQMMRNHGLELDKDYQVTEAGANLGRLQHMRDKKYVGTPLLGGTELRAQAEGMVILEPVTEAVPNYLASTISGRESWMKQNRDVVERLLRAYRKANDWVFDPANREAVIALIAKNFSVVGEDLAEQEYKVQIADDTGIIRDMNIDKDGLRTVLQLRQEWGSLAGQQDFDLDIDRLVTPEGGLYDTSYLGQAR